MRNGKREQVGCGAVGRSGGRGGHSGRWRSHWFEPPVTLRCSLSLSHSTHTSSSFFSLSFPTSLLATFILSCSSTEAILHTHACRYWDGKRCWRKRKGGGRGKSFRGAHGPLGERDLQTHPLQAGLGRWPLGLAAEQGAPSSTPGSEGQAAGTQLSPEPVSQPARRRFCAGELPEGELEVESLPEGDGGLCLICGRQSPQALYRQADGAGSGRDLPQHLIPAAIWRVST